MKKIAYCLLVSQIISLSAITSKIEHQTLTTAPLLYDLVDYLEDSPGLEVAPIYSRMYDQSTTNSHLILHGKNTLVFDQKGDGDLNPMWLNLMSDNQLADYRSQVTFSPKFSQAGALVHYYYTPDNHAWFFDVRTALIACQTEVAIEEKGGGNGLIPGVLNAQQAFTQESWNYGKIGLSQHVVGLDDVQVLVGTTRPCSQAENCNISVFGVIQAPTGTGTQAEWLFEPQVGTNHWGLGCGSELIAYCDNEVRVFVGANYRYSFSAWETRSFDLASNGQWSRYLGLQLVNSDNLALAIPGINIMTQKAKINGRSQLNIYTSLEKYFASNWIVKCGYNYLYSEKETIKDITPLLSDYGIYAVSSQFGNGGGISTSSSAHINQADTQLDPEMVPLSTSMLNKISAAAGTVSFHKVTTHIGYIQDCYNFSIGGTIDVALSSSAISTWAVWANFEYTFNY